ncbi:MAG: 3-keto-disaccharide hydrolase [Ilyomonas sp.]
MMIKNSILIVLVLMLASCSSSQKARGDKGWISLFNGQSLDGWKVSENPQTFSVEDGSIKVAGPRSHLYYDGAVSNHVFKNFELKMQVMTKPGSNSGVYFHTEYQAKGFPDKGFEVQVNNSHTDWKRTAGLYDIVDTRDVNVGDNEWFTLYINVQGKHVITKINDKTVVDYTEPEGAVAPKNHPGRLISSGTFALQGHDPKSIVFYKDIMVKPLP